MDFCKSLKGVKILDQPSPDEKIQKYLENYIESPGFGGKKFCAYELFGRAESLLRDTERRAGIYYQLR